MIGIQTNVFLVFKWIYIFVVSVIIIESDSRQKAHLIFEKNETFLSTESKLRKIFALFETMSQVEKIYA